MKRINTYIQRFCILLLFLQLCGTIALAAPFPAFNQKVSFDCPGSNPTLSKTLQSLHIPSYRVNPAVDGVVSLSNGGVVVIDKGMAVGVRVPTLTKVKTQKEIELEVKKATARIQGKTLVLSNRVKSIGVTDLTGRVILGVTNSNRLTLDLPQGTYILRYEDDGYRVTNKLVML